MCNVAGRDVTSVVNDCKKVVDPLVAEMPGYRVEYGGQFESAAEAGRIIALLGIAVVIGIGFLLHLAFGSARDAALIMLNLPLALIGGVVGVFVSGGVLSVASLIGFITVFGIATRNGIMLVSHIKHLEEHEGVTDFREAVFRGRDGAAGAHPDDRAGGRAGADSAGAGRAQTRQRDPDADGHCHPVWPADFDAVEHDCRPGALPALRAAGGSGLNEVRMKKQIVTLLFVAALGGVAAMAAANEAKPTVKQVENLTLDQALEMAESLQPELAEAKAMVEAAEGRARQAGAFPNPEAIRRGAAASASAATPPTKRNTWPASGRRFRSAAVSRKARQAELLDREVRARGLEVKRRDIRKRVHSAFATALYQEKAYQAQTEIQQNAAKAVATTQARVEAGDALREDLARVEMELARAKVELQRAESLREQALVALASAMGDATLSVKSLAGTLDATFEIPTLETLAANLSAQPESALAEADIRARNARVDVAKAERIPDVKVELLYHRLESSQAEHLRRGPEHSAAAVQPEPGPAPRSPRRSGRRRSPVAHDAKRTDHAAARIPPATDRRAGQQPHVEDRNPLAGRDGAEGRRSALRRRGHQPGRDSARAPRLGGGATELPGIAARRDAGVGRALAVCKPPVNSVNRPPIP